ncbi:MAG TPA: serine/threonine-protein kinase [Kofleriaceae bacterium]|nr:serine/threonine-protein kinase [Kofleriaceae bacterium]
MGPDLVKIGEVVDGRYKIIRPIADGGMGTVFLAEHWLIKRRVAMKILHAELAHDATMIRRFMNEALAAGTLGHPNIVESTDMGFTKGDVPYIVFEYLEGTVLADEILRRARIPFDRALKIAYQIASALDAAHEAGIVHRDLKTDNIFLTSRRNVTDHVKVLDFGISRFLQATDKTGLGGNLLGTPEFMAPEQVLTPDTVDKRADIYAIGVVLFEMMTGSVPFRLEPQAPGKLDVEAAHRLLDRIINERPPPFDCPEAPAGFADMVVDKLLAKDRNKRYQTMKEVQAALTAFAGVASMPITLAVESKLAPPPTPVDPGIAQLTDQTVSRQRLAPNELAREVQQLGKRWKLCGSDLVLDVFSREMQKLAAVVTTAAAIADEMDMQPIIAIELPRMRLTIANAGAVMDLVFAARVEQWLLEQTW